MAKCYCQYCHNKTKPLRKFHVVVWERIVRCADVEILATNEVEAKHLAKQHYQDNRDNLEGNWEEDRESCQPVVGKIGRPLTSIGGGNEFIGLEIEEN